MKKKLCLLIVIFTNISYFCVAQPPADRPLKRAEALHVAYLTRELGLTSAEGQTFWPLYRTYIDELKSVRKEKRGDPLAFEEGVLNVRKKYKPDFKKILGSDDRVNKMFVAERKFWEILKRELMNRRMKQDKIEEPSGP